MMSEFSWVDRREESLIERTLFAYAFVLKSGTLFVLQTFETPALGSVTARSGL